MKKNIGQVFIDVLIFIIVIYIPLFLLIYTNNKNGYSFEFSPDEEWFTYKKDIDSFNNKNYDDDYDDDSWIKSVDWDSYQDWEK